MNYKAFISMLYIKGTGITKDQFTKNLFLSSVYDTSVIIDKRASDSSYKGYNRGNPIDEIAYDVISQPENINISGIEELIEKYLNSKPDKKSEYEQRICSKFKVYIPDITLENICQRIAAFFIDEVLTPAFNNYKAKNNISDVDVSIKPDEKNKTIENDNSVSSNKVNKERDVSGTNTTTNIFNNRVEDNSIDATLNMAVQKNYDNHNEDNSIKTIITNTTNNITLSEDNSRNTIINNTPSKSSDELVELKKLITELNSLFMNLDEKGRSIHISSGLCSEEEQKEKEQEFETIKSDFINEHKKLRKYYLSFSELKGNFEKMISLSLTLTFWYGFKNDNQNQTRIVCDHQIEKYSKCINEVWNALPK